MAVLVSPVLVGRRDELDLLLMAAERAAAGEPAIVLVGGEAGVGKTRLVEEAATRATGLGARVVTGACVELGGEGLPFAPLVDILRALVRSMPAEELDTVLGPARRELARLLPELDPDAPVSPAGDGNQASRLFELVLGVVGRLAEESPLMLVVEDLHWADRSTVDLVAFLVRTLRAVPVVMVGTYRSDELHRRHPLRPLLASLERVRTVERLELARFTRGEVSEQLEAILDSPAEPTLVDEVFERSEGNAFLVEETLGIARAGADVERLPPSLRDVLLARAERMDDSVRQVLRAVAAAGSRVPESLLAAVADLAEPALFEALREAVEHHLLVVDESGYAFRHTLMRDAVYYDMLPGERTRLHRTYADAVEADPSLAGDEGSAAAALAHHSYAALDLPRALAAAVKAARHATTAFAPADAERHLERALEVWSQVPDAEERAGMDRLGLIELAVDAAISAGDESRALALVDDVLPTVDRDSQAARAALLLARRGEALRWLGRGDGVAELEEALALLPADPATPELAEVLSMLGSAKLLNAQMVEARDVARRAVDAARAMGDSRREASALISLGGAIGYLGETEQGLATIEEGLGVAKRAEDHAAAVRAYTNLSDALELAGRHTESSAVAREGLAFAQRMGLAGRWGFFLAFNAAEPLFAIGRWDEADEVLAESAESNPPSERSLPLYQLRARITLARGQHDEATRQFELIQSVSGEGLDFQTGFDQALLEVEVHHTARDLDAARATVRRALSDHDASRVGRVAWPLVWRGVRAEADRAAIARDRRDAEDPETQAWAEELARIAEGLPTPSAVSRGYAALVAAEQERLAGEPARDAWREAEAAWRAAGEPYQLAYALLRAGEAELAQGDRPAASAAVREAIQLAQGLGAEPLAAEAATLARMGRLALDDEPHEPLTSEAPTPFGLTDRELEVLRLIAAGRTNREIGGDLYMSPKTASAHVSRILSKLGVSGRVEAAAVAHRLGLSTAENDRSGLGHLGEGADLT
jgi:DNA-binding CsgD family transcriptional regulator/tetratricopeptide (TPR) repeat protein